MTTTTFTSNRRPYGAWHAFVRTGMACERTIALPQLGGSDAKVNPTNPGDGRA